MLCFSSHFCEYLVKLICYCVFFTFLSLYIDFFLFLFCEKATPVLLLETGNQRVFCHFSLFAEYVKLVIGEALQIYLLHLFIAQNTVISSAFFTITAITCEL